eukprot:symbB.v1.2.017523.t1/scaffold1370.1/size122994/14
MALPELALKSLRVPGWNVNVIEYRHTARGILGGLMEASRSEDAADVPVPNLAAQLLTEHPEWRLLRLVLHEPGADPVGAKPVPVSFFSTTPAPIPDVVVRRATDRDRPQWEALFSEYRVSQIPEGSPPSTDTIAAAEAVWAMLSSKHGWRGQLLLATSGSTLLGAAHLVMQPRAASHEGSWDGDGPAAYRGFLSDIFVSPAAKGKGIGRALMSRVFEACEDAELPEISWFCLSENASAMSFYEGLGFTPTAATVWNYPEMYEKMP